MKFSDFSSESLARLEAKLLADVEVVRRMRVLLEEHREAWEGRASGGATAGAAAPGASAGVGAPPAVREPAPGKSLEDLAMEFLESLTGETFVTEDLRRALQKRGSNPRETSLKTLMNRLVRTGKVVVHELRKGRGGSLYRCTMSRPPGEHAAPAASDSGAIPWDAGNFPAAT